MKKLIALVLSLVCVLSLVGCNTTKPHTDTPIEGTTNEAQPEDTPIDESFDIAVSYANCGELNDIYTKALNVDKLAISSVRHLPI